MSVIKLAPSFKDYMWGGNNLKKFYNKKTESDILAESWEVSTHSDGPSTVASGPLKGKTLKEYIDIKGNYVLGLRGQKFDFFPILIKLIDAERDLSIQVHPNDEYALKNEGGYGKTEMWYILQATDEAKIYYGTKNKINKKEFREAIDNNNILELINEVPVKKGDVVFVEAGTIHAIGAGIVICEIQQNSNITYRVHDFDRIDTMGKKRELHIEKAIEVSNLIPIITTFNAVGERKAFGERYETKLIEGELFEVALIELQGDMMYHVDDKSFHAVICIEGMMTITHESTEVSLLKGESAFVDANTYSIKIEGKANFLRVNV